MSTQETLPEGSSASDVSETPKSGGLDLYQIVFWTSLLVAAAAACVAIIRPDAVGATGPIFLITLATGGMVFLIWVMRGAGRKLGLFPEKGAAEAAISARKSPYSWIESLDEAVLVTENGGGSVAANTAYEKLTADLGTVADPERAATVDRLFGANPGLNAPIYRLSRSARAGETRREILPAIAMGGDNIPVQFEVAVSPLERERALWRLRRIAGMTEATGAADARALFIEDAPLGFVVAQGNGRVTYVNAWLRDFLGLPDDLGTLRVEDIMRPESLKAFRRDRRSGQATRLELYLRARDGVETMVQTITSWNGKGSEALSRTLVMAPANAPLSSEERLTAVSSSRPVRMDSDPMFEQAPFGVVRLEGESLASAQILDANKSLIEMTNGIATPGTQFASLFNSDDGETELAKTLLSAVDGPVELEVAGDPPSNVSVFVTLDESGRPATAYLIDVTEHKQLEMRVAHGEKMQAIGELAGGVAHDFNNMLTGVILNCDKLLQRHPVGDPSFHELQSIKDLSARAAELVKMLLAFSRQQTFKRDVLNVTDMLSDFQVLLRQILDERIELKVQHGRDLPYIRADQGQIENAILNLATNARDAMMSSGGGTLTIKTSRSTGEEAAQAGFDVVDDGDYLRIEVSDNGSGMPPEVLEKIFQPFFTTKEQGKGTGFGLATVYGIVKQSEGFICPVSKVGKGTSFNIFLPALSSAEVENVTSIEVAEPVRPKPQGPTDLAGRGHIMLVEDEDGVRGIAANLLASRGYKVIEAADGEEALDLIKEHEGDIDLLISDVVLPGIDGPSLMREAREHLGHARIMFISGYAERDFSKTLDEERSISFLPKPFTLEQLAQRVKEELTAA